MKEKNSVQNTTFAIRLLLNIKGVMNNTCENASRTSYTSQSRNCC
ncbi:hypothetical protein SLW70_00200 [Flavobacterium sp. NG2]|nr:hypothetical protein [Flavobacterium sp. NG2]WPR71580.1 hypothetical protein SLW70_00200 [Flavobacterium sp. NG2]